MEKKETIKAVAVEKSISSKTKNTTNIYFVRHGERVDDAGHDPETYLDYDPHLTSTGKKQALHTGKTILGLEKARNPESKFIIISSPFIRCIETAAGMADAIGEDKLASPEIYLDKSISEFFSPMKAIIEDPEGKLFYQINPKEFERAYPKRELKQSFLPSNEIIIGFPEVLMRFFERTEMFRNELGKYLLNQKQEVAVIVCTHGTAIKGLLNGLTTDRISTPYCGISRVSFDSLGNFSLVSLPSGAHLHNMK